MIQKTDFMCTCKANEDSIKKSEECLARVLEELKCDRGKLLTNVVYSLEHGLSGKFRTEGDFYGAIEGIGCDMWCGVSAIVQKYNAEIKKYEDYASIYVQCDEVEYGIARVWELAKEAVNE